MIPAYDKVYLEKARTALGRMLDFAVYDLKYGLEDFFSLFLASGTADRFEHGDFTLLVGMSGTELAYEVLEQSGIVQKRIRPKYTMNRSEEYWTGWALAYYQWERAGSFSEIVRCVPICRIRELYFPYHEMDIRHFCDRMDELYRRGETVTNLKRMRKNAGLSQSGLAELTGISVRTIQQYEQRQKSINHAQVDYLVRFSRALDCDVMDLVERF